MVDNGEGDSDAEASGQGAEVPAAGWQYIGELLAELEKFDSESLRGRDRFVPELELRYAPAQFRSILAIAKRLMQADRTQVPVEVTDQVETALADLLELADEITGWPVEPGGRSSPGVERTSERGQRRLRELLTFFSSEVEPVAGEASSQPHGEREGIPGLSPSEIDDIRRTRKELEESRGELADLKARHSEISAELESRRELIEATRAQMGSEGAKELASAYAETAKNQARQWKIWGVGLVWATLAALVGGYLIISDNQPPDDATTAQIVSHIAMDLLIVGLLIFVVRITSRQFSVHRHLATVAHNKAAALMTFARIVSSGSSVEARDRLTDVLAHYVFTSDNTGFLSSDGDQITLPERLAGPIGQRLGGSA